MLTMTNKKEEKIFVSEHIALFKSRLKNLRKARNKTQDEVADGILVVRQTYAKYESVSSTTIPDINVFRNICKFFDVSPNYFLGYSETYTDHKKYYGLSAQTVNNLQDFPDIQSFVDYFVEQIVDNNLEPIISQIGISNNYEKAWDTIFPKWIITAVDSAYDEMTKSAIFSCSISIEDMENFLRKELTMSDFKRNFNRLDANAKSFIYSKESNFLKLDDEQKYDFFIKSLCSIFYEDKSAKLIHKVTRKKIEDELIEIIKNYKKTVKTKEEYDKKAEF